MVQRLIQEKQSVEIVLMTGESQTGRIFWQDVSCLCLVTPDDQQTLIWRQAIATLKPLSA
jgi:host factor-I protein